MDRKHIQYLDPKNDLTFRRIFGEHPHIMKSFLNSVMPFEDDRYIETLTYQDPALIPVLPELKHSIVDVKCADNYGRQFIVEMQMYWTTTFKSRMLFNAGKAYVKQLDKGHKYSKLCPVYGLSLVNDTFLTDEKYKDQYYHHYKMLHSEISEEVIEGIELIFIELPKFRPNTFTEKKLRNLWLRFLTEIDENTQEIEKDFLENATIKDALEQLQVSAFTKEELEYYDKYWDNIRVEQARIDDLQRKHGTEISEKDRALEEAKQSEKEAKQREKEAKEREEEERRQKEDERSQKRAIQQKLAKKMLAYGEPIEVVMKETGLSEEDVKSQNY